MIWVFRVWERTGRVIYETWGDPYVELSGQDKKENDDLVNFVGVFFFLFFLSTQLVINMENDGLILYKLDIIQIAASGLPWAVSFKKILSQKIRKRMVPKLFSLEIKFESAISLLLNIPKTWQVNMFFFCFFVYWWLMLALYLTCVHWNQGFC